MENILSNKLEIFIITYNRWNLLYDTIQSFYNQTTNTVSITVIDNGSSVKPDYDVEDIFNLNLKLIRLEENDQFNVWTVIKNIVSKDWLMVFHDDDLLHPEYIKSILSLISNNPKADVIGCATSTFTNKPKKIRIKKLKYLNCRSKSQFVNELISGFPLSFCSVVYKTSSFLDNSFDHKKYGKIGDRPFVINMIKENGSGLLIKNKLIYTRLHKNQDSNKVISNNHNKHIYNHLKFYRDCLFENNHNQYKYNFHKRILYISRDFYDWGISKNLSFNQFLSEGIENGCFTKKEILYSRIYNYSLNPKFVLKRLLKCINII